MGKLTVKNLDSASQVPERSQISAVFLVAIQDGKILTARNERGWDIPGGHLDGTESMLDGLQREVGEEAGAIFYKPVPYAILLADWTDKLMLFFASNNFELGNFTPSDDAFERDVMEIDEFINLYHGDKVIMLELVNLAIKAL